MTRDIVSNLIGLFSAIAAIAGVFLVLGGFMLAVVKTFVVKED